MPLIILRNNPLFELMHTAITGYETPYKQERFGFLLGHERSGERIDILKAIPYRGGIRTRTMVEYDLDALVRRARELSRRHRMSWLGCYHTHVDSNGTIFHALSDEDRETFREMYEEIDSIRIEMTVNIHASRNRSRPASRTKTLIIHDDKDYRYLIKGYTMLREGIRQIPVRRPAEPG